MSGTLLGLGENSMNQTNRVSVPEESSRKDGRWPSSYSVASLNKRGDKGIMRAPQSLGSKLLFIL